jgi:hypothetical protein
MNMYNGQRRGTTIATIENEQRTKRKSSSFE